MNDIDRPVLTDRQRLAVEQPDDALLLVTAGPGAGKTHTVLHRLDHLVETEGLVAGEILVLTFSRAAVRELRDRLAVRGSAARFVRVRTFDSWALDVLRTVDAQGEWEQRSFGARITGACRAIEDGRADELCDELAHVVIDEVQDLVGDRRELVEALLYSFDGGFTVVGDPAQSIYGFTVHDPERREEETNRFFTWLRNTFGDDLTQLALEENFRARTPEARTALPFAPIIQGMSEASPGERARTFGDLRQSLRSAFDLGELNAVVVDVLGHYDGTTAVLCRTNGQALVVAELLAEAGIDHRLQRSVTDRTVPAFVAALFHDAIGTALARTRFDETLADLRADERDRRWRLLRRACDGRGREDVLDLLALRGALARGALPDELVAPPAANLIVSSFHRAKGLEFDRVVVVDSETHKDMEPGEEARLLYVAMTRPREELMWTTFEKSSKPVLKDSAVDRWGRYGWKGRTWWQRHGMEVDGRDVLSIRPAGLDARDIAPREVQVLLAEKVAGGDGVEMHRMTEAAPSDDLSPEYSIVWEGLEIGVASERFRSDLCRHLRRGRSLPRSWPRAVTGIRVESIETVIGEEAAGRRAGFGPHGVWLAPRMVGLGRFHWDSNTDGREEANDARSH